MVVSEFKGVNILILLSAWVVGSDDYSTQTMGQKSESIGESHCQEMSDNVTLADSFLGYPSEKYKLVRNYLPCENKGC